MHFLSFLIKKWPADRKNPSILPKAVAIGERLPLVWHLTTDHLMPVTPVVSIDAQNPMPRIVLVDTSIGNVLVEVSTTSKLAVKCPATLVEKMSTKKFKWLTLGLASIVVSGCAAGSKPNLNLGIADALRKSKACLFKKKLSYQTPASNTRFGYATPVTSDSVMLPSTTSRPIASSQSPIYHQSAENPSVLSSDCNCSTANNVAVPSSGFYMPPPPAIETPASTPSMSEGSAGSFDSVPTLELPHDTSVDHLQLQNPLPPAVEVPTTQPNPSVGLNESGSDVEERIIDTLDSASLDFDELKETPVVTPKKDEASILETAAKALEAKTPTSAGQSVVERRSKIVTLTARPAQSHQVFDAQTARKTQADMQQVTHKRHFRQQNSLRPLHTQFRRNAVEHTAEVPSVIKFKPLPVLSKESPAEQPSGVNTGAPALKQKSLPKVLKNSSTGIQHLPAPVPDPKSIEEQGSVSKIGRLPILKAETVSSAAIGGLRNFTNVRDLDPASDKSDNAGTNAETATVKATAVTTITVSDSDDELAIQR